MKLNNILKKVITFGMCCALLISNVVVVGATEVDSREKSIYDYEQFVNNKELNNYIQLFDSRTQSEMRKVQNDPEFFLGEQIEIKQIKLLSRETGERAAFIEEKEFGNNETSVYYVQATCDTNEVKNANIKSLHGDISYVFVFVKENNIWKIGRISIADISEIKIAGEGFNNNTENTMLAKENLAMTRASLSIPSSICVKMTKTANQNYWGQTYVDVPFEEYILDVVPNEFIVSYGGEYLKAGTMAVKMYGWYYTIHKKYPNSPGGCDVQDTSSDQNYDVGSYDDLGHYKTTMDTAYNAVDDKALVMNSGSIFCTQYLNSTTNSTTGQLGASTAKSLSDAGYTYLTILKNAYDNSNNAGGETVKIVSH